MIPNSDRLRERRARSSFALRVFQVSLEISLTHKQKQSRFKRLSRPPTVSRFFIQAAGGDQPVRRGWTCTASYVASVKLRGELCSPLDCKVSRESTDAKT